MDVETIIESAVKQGFDQNLVFRALKLGDQESLEIFIGQLNEAKASKTSREVLRHMLTMAENSPREQAVDVLGALLEVNHHEVSRVIELLIEIRNEQAVTLVRKVLDSKWKYSAAKIFIELYYLGDAVPALTDDAEIVRWTAAKALERDLNDAMLVTALTNDSASVRQIAAWYMGRRLVKESVEPLIELVKAEGDTETLRAAIWSLGVLRDQQALPCIEALCQHDEPVIVATAQEAIKKLAEIESNGN